MSEPPPPFSFKQFNTLIDGIERLSDYGRRVSDSIASQPCEYLIQEATMAFVKPMMSVQAFLRFIPSSRFHAKKVEFAIDLSSASVMARQVLEDSISFFYLSEGNLTPDERAFRELVWRFQGATEAIDSATSFNVPNPELSPTATEHDRFGKHLDDPRFREMLEAIERGRRGRIRQGRENQVLHDREILMRRGIRTDETYDAWRRVLSNFAHFSTLSHRMMMQTSADWEKSWFPFLTPALCVASFAAEGIEAFFETFPQTRGLLTGEEQL
jgi:hypothetical protein